MTHHLARQVKQAPTHRRHLVAQPVSAQNRMLEQNEQVVGDDADAEERGIRGELSAGHALHAEADLQFLDAVLGHLAALAVPDQGGFRRFFAVAGDHVIPGRVAEQFALKFVFDDDQPERFLGVVHAVQGFSHRAVRVVFPARLRDVGDGLLRGFVQPPADGERSCRCHRSN